MKELYCWINKSLSQIIAVRGDRLFLYSNDSWCEIDVASSDDPIAVAAGLADAWSLQAAPRAVAEVLCGHDQPGPGA